MKRREFMLAGVGAVAVAGLPCFGGETKPPLVKLRKGRRVIIEATNGTGRTIERGQAVKIVSTKDGLLIVG